MENFKIVPKFINIPIQPEKLSLMIGAKNCISIKIVINIRVPTTLQNEKVFFFLNCYYATTDGCYLVKITLTRVNKL